MDYSDPYSAAASDRPSLTNPARSHCVSWTNLETIHDLVDAEDVPGIEFSHFLLQRRGSIAFERDDGLPGGDADTFIVDNFSYLQFALSNCNAIVIHKTKSLMSRVLVLPQALPSSPMDGTMGTNSPHRFSLMPQNATAPIHRTYQCPKINADGGHI